jgi:hypothetical protein
MSSEQFLSTRSSEQNSVWIIHLPMGSTWHAHLIFLDLFILIIFNGGNQVIFSVIIFLHLFGFIYSLKHPVLTQDTLNLCSFRNVRDQISRPYKTTGKIKLLYVLICTSLEGRRGGKRLWTDGNKPSPNFDCSVDKTTKFHEKGRGEDIDYIPVNIKKHIGQTDLSCHAV